MFNKRSYGNSRVWTEEAMDTMTKAAFVQGVRDLPNGEAVKLSAELSDVTRRVLLENAFLPHIIEPKPITASEWIPNVGTTAVSAVGVSEIGFKLCNLEPYSPGGRDTPFTAGPQQRTFRGEYYKITIGREETPELYKHVDELASYDYDIRSLLVDTMLRHLDNRQDYRFIATVDAITGSDPNANGAGNYRQYRTVSGSVEKETYKQTLRPLIDAQLNNGVFLMNRQTALEFLAWNAIDIGDENASRMFQQGLNALDKFEIHGVPHIVTIKADLVPIGRVYHFVPQNWLGRHYIYEDTKVFVKREKDYIHTSASRKYGVGIGHMAGVAATQFLNVA